MRPTTILRRLLGVTQLNVENGHVAADGPLAVWVRPSWRRSRCGACGRRAPRYDRRPRRRWLHVPWGRTRSGCSTRRGGCPAVSSEVHALLSVRRRVGRTRPFLLVLPLEQRLPPLHGHYPSRRRSSRAVFRVRLLAFRPSHLDCGLSTGARFSGRASRKPVHVPGGSAPVLLPVLVLQRQERLHRIVPLLRPRSPVRRPAVPGPGLAGLPPLPVTRLPLRVRQRHDYSTPST